MLERFKKFLQAEQVLCQGEKLLLAFSSGIDSVCLAQLLLQADIKFGIAHANFALRGSESDADATFAQEFAQKYGLSFYTKKFETKSYAKEKGISTQMAARELRYAWFDGLMHTEGYPFLATAHHADDNLETMLLNLVRGTGLAGIRGMQPKNGNIIRPLLWAGKDEIISYVKQNGWNWRDDASNAEDYYKRNFVRHNIIPLLKELNPALTEGSVTSAYKLRAAEHFYSLYMDGMKDVWKSNPNPPFNIHHPTIKNLKFADFALFTLLEEYGFSLEQCRKMVDENRESGKRFLSQKYQAIIDRDQIRVDILRDEDDWEFLLGFAGQGFEFYENGYEFKAVLKEKGDVRMSKNANLAFLDADKLGFLKLRNRRLGDKLKPLGMHGQKLLSDYMIDAKIPLNLKNRIPILCSDESIVWVAGYGIADDFKITEQTQRVLEIHYHYSYD